MCIYIASVEDFALEAATFSFLMQDHFYGRLNSSIPNFLIYTYIHTDKVKTNGFKNLTWVHIMSERVVTALCAHTCESEVVNRQNHHPSLS